jgi:hypothetical protein
MNKIDGNNLSAAGAMFNFDRTPYLRDIVDCLGVNSARKIVVMKSASIGFSESTVKYKVYNRVPRKQKKRWKKQKAAHDNLIEKVIKREYKKIENTPPEKLNRVMRFTLPVPVKRIKAEDFPNGFNFGDI